MLILLLSVAALVAVFIGVQRYVSRLEAMHPPAAASPPETVTLGASDVTTHALHTAAWSELAQPPTTDP